MISQKTMAFYKYFVAF